MKYFKPHTIVSVVVDKNDDNDDVNIILGLHVKSGGNRVKNTAKQKNKLDGFWLFWRRFSTVLVPRTEA